ncbi:hypothetical protein KAW50_05380 [candidate division WOR-3 bacterium]|nr:hypothetical protein [candidate division WOR-3 bacterium]
MKKLTMLILLISIGIFSQLSAQTYSDLIKIAREAYRNKEYLKSAENYEKAFEQKEVRNRDYYDAACSRALAGNVENAFKNLNLAIDKGWLHLEHTKTDPDLESLHNEKGWNTVIEKLGKKIEEYEASLNTELVQKLKDIGEKDQRCRKQMREVGKKYGWQSDEMKELGKKQNELDSLNLIRIEAIIEEYGYPGKSLVGMQSSVAFLVIQHSDLETQEKYLPLLKESADKGELSWASLALLIDRIHTRKGEKQIYGSQIKQTEDGKYELGPIEDEPNVNKRRAKVGLGPLEEYVKHWNIKYTVPKE